MSKIKNLKNNSNVNYLLNLFNKGQYVFYISIIERVIYFFLFVLLARSLENDQYGMIIAIFAFANIISVMFNFGLPTNIQRVSSSKKNNTNEQFINSLIIKFISFLCLMFISVFYYSYSNISSTYNFYLIVTSIFFFSINNLVQHLFYGLKRFKEIFTPFIISRLLFFLSIILFSLNIIELEYLFSIFFISSIIEFIFLISILVKENLITLDISFDFILVREILKSSLPIGLGLFCVVIYDKVDIILIEKLLGVESVGYYSIAYSIYKIPQLLSSSILVPFYSDITNNYKQNRLSKILKVAILMLIISSSAILIIQFWGGYLIAILFGITYERATIYLQIIIFSLPFLLLNNLTGVILNSIGLEKKVLNSAIIASSCNILLNLLLINIWGLFGAVVTTIFTETLIFLIQIFYIYQNKKTILNE